MLGAQPAAAVALAVPCKYSHSFGAASFEESTVAAPLPYSLRINKNKFTAEFIAILL